MMIGQLQSRWRFESWKTYTIFPSSVWKVNPKHQHTPTRNLYFSSILKSWQIENGLTQNIEMIQADFELSISLSPAYKATADS